MKLSLNEQPSRELVIRSSKPMDTAALASNKCFYSSIPIYELDPLTDSRWPRFVDRNPRSGIFHTCEWLRALERSFGYKAVVFTLSEPGAELESGIPFCRIESRFTGKRLVSLPFSDHCDPLGTEADLCDLLAGLAGTTAAKGMRYIEIRPSKSVPSANLRSGECFFLHRLDLSPSLEVIFHSLQKSSIQRSIRRAERLGVELRQGRSEWHLQAFYKLFVVTRRRLQAPPQPLQWFRNLLASLGSKINILVATKDDRPIASIITLTHKQTTTYKYGGSDASLHSLGGMPFLFWNAIEAAKLGGSIEFDFGRTDIDNVGLATFKDRWGASRVPLTYLRQGELSKGSWNALPAMKILRRSFFYMPESILIKLGDIAYRHIG